MRATNVWFGQVCGGDVAEDFAARVDDALATALVADELLQLASLEVCRATRGGEANALG